MLAILIRWFEERTEEKLLILFCDADSLVQYAYPDYPFWSLLQLKVCNDTQLWASVWEFDAVGKQVEKDLLQAWVVKEEHLA